MASAVLNPIATDRSFDLSQTTVRALNQWLHTELAGSGGEGKQLVASGAVRVDGAVELRKTAKIRAGQCVRLGDVEIRVVPA